MRIVGKLTGKEEKINLDDTYKILKKEIIITISRNKRIIFPKGTKVKISEIENSFFVSATFKNPYSSMIYKRIISRNNVE